MATRLTKPVVRVAPRKREPLVVTLYPAEGDMEASVEVRPLRVRAKSAVHRVTLGQLYTMLALKAAAATPRPRRRVRVRRGGLL